MRTLALCCLRRSKRSLGHNPTKLYIARNLKAAREIIFRRPIFIKSSLYFQQIEADAAALREIVTDLTGKSDNAVILLAAVNDGKVSLCAGVSKALTGKVKAGDLVKFAAEQVGGKGGGRPDLAQAGGTDAAKLPEMLGSVEGWVSSKLA